MITRQKTVLLLQKKKNHNFVSHSKKYVHIGLLFLCVDTMINPHDKSIDENCSSEFAKTL